VALGGVFLVEKGKANLHIMVSTFGFYRLITIFLDFVHLLLYLYKRFLLLIGQICPYDCLGKYIEFPSSALFSLSIFPVIFPPIRQTRAFLINSKSINVTSIQVIPSVHSRKCHTLEL
jgi:hypothetical protein